MQSVPNNIICYPVLLSSKHNGLKTCKLKEHIKTNTLENLSLIHISIQDFIEMLDTDIYFHQLLRFMTLVVGYPQ